jgi:hypothetical protein
MTPSDLTSSPDKSGEITARLEYASEGPWRSQMTVDRKWNQLFRKNDDDQEWPIGLIADDDDAEFIAHAPEDIRYLLGLRNAALAIHHVEKRYQSSPEAEESYDTAEQVAEEQVAEEQDMPLADVTFFEVCAECGRIELDIQGDWDVRAYKESLWPCATVKALGVTE